MKHRTDVVLRGLGRFLEQWKDRPLLTGLITPWLAELQRIEDAAFEVATLRYLETSEGAQLDGIGVILNTPRADRSDADYLIALKAEILILRCQGDPPTIELILSKCCPSPFVFAEFYPMGLEITLLDVPAFSVDTLWGILHRCKAAAVRLELTYPTSTHGFKFAPYGATDPVFDPDHGFVHSATGGTLPYTRTT